jgi:regulator of sigma E protease
MITVLAAIFVFSILVIIHELGHFLAARWMGVRVEKFSIGFPPTVYTKKIGETQFAISAIPLGGYVKMAGFVDESMDTNTTGAPDEFNSKPVWRRIIIIVAGVVMNLFLAIAVMAILNFIEGEKIIPGSAIGKVGKGGIGEKTGFQPNDQILSVNGVPVSTWNDIQTEFVRNFNADIIFRVNRIGNTIDLKYQKEWFKEEHGEQLDLLPLFSTKVGDITVGMPAAEIGLKTGDQIMSIAGKPVSDWNEMTQTIRAHPNQQIDIVWLRSADTLRHSIIPQPFEERDEDKKAVMVGKIGIGYFYEHKEINAFTAALTGVTDTYDLIILQIRSIYWIITGIKHAEDMIGGPLAIAKMAGEAVQDGWDKLWRLIAGLSAMLAFINILPIPALDGGHLLFLIIEGVMGKPLSINTRLRVQQIGMAILFSLIILVFYVDIKRFLF